MGMWRQGQVLTDRTVEVVRQHRVLLTYPVRAAVYGTVASLVPIGLGVAVGVVLDNTAGAVIAAVCVVLGAVLGSIVAVLQMAMLVALADQVLRGREPDEAAARALVAERRSTLAGWALLNLLVGMLVSAIQGGGSDNAGAAIARTLLAGAVSVAWALITFLVLPVIIIEGPGPVGAIKRSSALVKQRWGTAVSGGVRIGFRYFLMLSLPGLLLGAIGVGVALALDNPAGIVLGALLVLAGVGLLLVGAVMMSTARNVFGVALYHYAASGEVVGPFDAGDLEAAVKLNRA